MKYPGGKNGEGVYQQIINLMPPHRVYIEPFLGSGAVLRNKAPAALNIGSDIDETVIRRWTEDNRSFEPAPDSKLLLFNCPALKLLRYPYDAPDTLIYCDPPYLRSSRSSQRRPIYKHELWTEKEHRQLLAALLKLHAAKVIISGYQSKLYAELLSGWSEHTFQTTTHRGQVRTEHLWFNFPRPLALHDYRHLGEDFRERERIKRKTTRWTAKLQQMPALERHAMIHALQLAWGISAEPPKTHTR